MEPPAKIIVTTTTHVDEATEDSDAASIASDKTIVPGTVVTTNVMATERIEVGFF